MPIKRVAIAAFFIIGATVISGIGIANADTTINLSNSVDVSSAIPMGINLGTPNYYDSGQMMKNLIFNNNPSFQGEIYSQTVRCATGTATGCVDDDPYSGIPSNFWNGASYSFIYGTAEGRSGTITSSLAPANGNGSTYIFSNSGTTAVTGDVFLIEKTISGNADAGWGKSVTGNATDSTDFTDLPPGTAGTQALQISAPGTGDYFYLSNYFDTLTSKSFITMNGTYQISFQAKEVAGTTPISVSVERLSGLGTTFVTQNVPLSNTWNTYTVNFTANENGSQIPGPIQLKFGINAATVLMSNVSIMKTSGDPTNTTVFRDEVVNALKQYHPGVLRDWIGQLGDTINDQLTADSGMQTAEFSAFTPQQGSIFNVSDFLQLCQTVGADPWYVMPITTTPQDVQNLLQFLSAPTSTTYGAKRAALGHPAPWTQAFNTIHLELGNEEWNSGFKGGSIEYPQAYGTRADQIFAAAKSSPYYTSGKFDFVMGGQFVYLTRNSSEQTYDTHNDSLAVAAYFGTSVANSATTEDIFGPLLAEGEADSLSTGLMGENVAQSTVPVEIYEENIDASTGVTQSVVNEQKPSLGEGLALANNALLYLRDNHVKVQNVFALSQYDYADSGLTEPVWGITVDMSTAGLKRPSFYAMQLVNQAIGSGANMMTTTQTGDNPTWSESGENGVTISNAHDIQSYSFANGTTQSLVLFNLSRTSSLNVNFAGANAPQGSVTQTRLTSANIYDNNETASVVAPVTTVLSGFNPYASYSLPPYSETVLSWISSGTNSGDTTPPSVPTGLTANTISASQVNLTWTASTDNVGVAGYDVYRNGIQVGTTTTNSYPDSGLTASTTYTYTVSAYDSAGNVSAQSASASVTTLPTTSTQFTIGQSVQTTASLNVRSTPSTSGTLVGTEATGVVGTVSGGPSYANGYWWWNVNYTNGISGWSVQNYLTSAFSIITTPTSTTVGLATWWKLDDGSGSTVTDSSGNNNGGTLTGGYTWTTGILGDAVAFNGTTGMIASNNQATNPQTFSISTWFKTTTTLGGFIMGFSSDKTGYDNDRVIYMDNAGQLYFGLYSSYKVQTINTSASYNDGNWHLVTASLASDGMKLYVDGNLVASNPAVGATQAFNGYWRAAFGGLGGWTNIPADDYFAGTLDDIRIYSTELQASDVQNLYAAAMGTVTKDTTPPSIPTGLTATALSSSQINLTWTASTDNVGVAGYNIYRNGVEISGATSTSYSDSGLAASTAYTYTVSAYDSAGNVSAQSASASATTNANVLPLTIAVSPTTLAGSAPLIATFSGSASGGVSPYTYAWNFGDGNVGSGASVTHTYASVSTYTATLTVSDSASHTASVSAVVTIHQSIGMLPTSSQAVNGLSTWWKLDDGSGSTVTDSSGNNNGGTLTGGYTWTTGILGDAVTFNGTTGGIGSTNQATNPQTFSVASWFKTTTTVGGDIMGFSSGQSGYGANTDRLVYMDNGGHIYFGLYSAYRVQTIVTPGTYNDGNWHLVTASLASDGMKLYIDGNLVASNAAVTSAQVYNGYWRAGFTGLGGWTNTPSSYYFAGTLDDIRVYTTELQASDVQNLYNAGEGLNNSSTTAPTDAVTWWKFDDGSGSTAGDSSGNNNTGVLTGGYSWTMGILNGAIAFNGMTGALVSTNMFTNPQTFSLSTHFKTTTSNGGDIMGFSSSQSGYGANDDRIIYMDNGGHVYFGVYSGYTVQTIVTPGTYNDGNWHSVVASLAADGMKLYIDGNLVASNAAVTSAQVYNGYWRVGFDAIGGWTNTPSSYSFAGTIDDVRIFARELSAAEVSALNSQTVAIASPQNASGLADIGAIEPTRAQLETELASLFSELQSMLLRF